MTDLLSEYEDAWLAMGKAITTSNFFELSARSLPRPPLSLSTDTLCMTSHLHLYGDFPADAVSIEADKHTLGRLGLLIFSVVLHPDQLNVSLTLTHERSTIRELIISPPCGPTGNLPGLHVRPERFNYYPSSVDKHPWLDCLHYNVRPYDLPILQLTGPRKVISSHRDLEDRNTAEGFGSLEGACHLAELLLNASLPTNAQLEFELECECGFRGVGPGSAEMTIWLPGSSGNLDHDPLPDA